MSSVKKISLILVLGLLSCTDSEIMESLEDQNVWLGEVISILQRELSEPEGKLNLIYHYRGEDESSMVSYRKTFYDHEEREILDLGFSAENDTIGALLTYYNQKGEIIERKEYQYPDWQHSPNLNGGALDKLEWLRTVYFNYDTEGKLIEKETLMPNSEQKSKVIFHYNDLNQLVAKEYFQNNESIDWHAYEHDVHGVVHKETWKFSRFEEPYRTYLYRYNEKDLLTAKETGELYNAELEKKDVHQYFYDNMDRLIEEKEYYPNMGFQLFFRKAYKYHE
ncbi:hypothetical protein MM213_17655 [Belliella sp. R4-6]|uniref:YD repeat-containing protein n=1 Tax=Belliella alkalica TaxID=1730871 RepID=A0ABS9VFW5_9BACT|nr:hypothetical protein [Belliella alkalica]MCH7415331.1 hypothetical protein [Belliella alkalica]